MHDIPREQLIKRYQMLPVVMQSAIFSEQSADAIRKACVLREIEQSVSIVAKLTGRVLLGYLRPELFALEIQKETGVDMQKAQLVAHDIDGEIFSNVRLELKKLYPPVIQTPTVQTPWSNRTQAPEKFQDSSFKIQEKPKYVIPIPEKFRGQDLRFKNQDLRIEEPGIRNQESKTTNYELRIMNYETENMNKELGIRNYETGKEKKIPEPTPPVQENVKSTQPEIHNSQFIIQKNLETPQTPQTASTPPLPLKANEAVFKPIVPLPTFIRSQFKMEEAPKIGSRNNESGIRNEEEKQKEAKEFASKFSAPDQTLAKPEAPKTDPYKESL